SREGLPPGVCAMLAGTLCGGTPMADTTTGTIQSIRATVQSIELKLRQGELPEEGLDDLKRAIDDARLRLWAAISAAASSELGTVLLGFRLRRAIEICRGVS